MTITDFLNNDVNQMALGMGAVLFAIYLLLGYMDGFKW